MSLGREKRVWQSNLANTVMTCLLTITMCMIMYPLVWYHRLNEETLHQQVEHLQSIQPPALAWITIQDRHDFAQLLEWPRKGFVSDVAGGFDTYVQNCSSQSEEEILASHYCNCTEMFSPLLSAPLVGHAGGVVYRTFLPAPNIRFNTTDASLVLQVYSNRKAPSSWVSFARLC